MEENERSSQKVDQIGSKDVGDRSEQGLAIETGFKDWLEYVCQQSGDSGAGKTCFESGSARADAIHLEEKLLRDLIPQWSAEAFFDLISRNASAKDLTKGSEHYVIRYVDQAGERRVLKATLDGKFGRYEYSPSIYLNSLRLVNSLVPALDIRMHGVMDTGYGPSIVTSMHYILGQHPRQAEVAAYLGKRGWSQFQDGSPTLDFISEDLQHIIRDGHANNWVRQKGSGVLIPIDISIENTRPPSPAPTASATPRRSA